MFLAQKTRSEIHISKYDEYIRDLPAKQEGKDTRTHFNGITKYFAPETYF